MKRNIKVLLIALVVLALAGAAYGFAATNYLAASNVGFGTSSISGYRVAGINYVPLTDTVGVGEDAYDVTDPSKITEIDFTLDKPATHVSIQLDATEETGDVNWDWMTCTLPSTTTVECVPTAPAEFIDTQDIVKLNVYASDQNEAEFH